MTTLIPDGPVAQAVTTDPLTGNRASRYTYELLDLQGRLLGVLGGVQGGSLDWTANAAVKGAGRMLYVPQGTDIDWTKTRVRPVLNIDGMDPIPLGVFIAHIPTDDWTDGSVSRELELLDRTTVLNEDSVDSTYSIPKGTNVVNKVVELIQSTGESPGSVTPSSVVTANDMTWDPTTSKLTIVNDMLDAAGFFALWADTNGQFRVEPYQPPKKRPVIRELLDDARSIYLPDMTITRDTYAIPNKVILIGQGDGTTEAWVATATNEDPKSKFSYQSRGRWITYTESGVEVASQSILQDKAAEKLRQMTSPQSSIDIQHAVVPGLTANSVVRFRRTPASVDTKFTVTQTTIPLDPTALATTTLTEVIDL